MTDRAATPAHTKDLPDAARFRYIASLVTGQSLTLVPIGVFLFISDTTEVFSSTGQLISRAATIAALLAAALSFRYSPQYYRRRFGFVQPKELSASNRSFGILLLALLFLMFFGPSIGRFLDPLLVEATSSIHKALSDPLQRVSLLPFFLWPIAWWLRPRDGHGFLFLCFGAIFCASIAFYPAWHPDALQNTLWKMLNAGALGICIAAWGLYDYIVLLQMVPKPPAEDNDD